MHDWKVVDDLGANGEQMHENMNSGLLHKITHKLRLATFRFVRVNHITLNIQISRKWRNPQSFLNALVFCDSLSCQATIDITCSNLSNLQLP